MANQNGSNNGAADTTAETILNTLHSEFEKNHKGKTSKKRVAELVGAYLAAQSNRIKAERAVEEAVKAESEAAKSIIREASGKSRVTMGGVLYSPMSRKDRVFFRKESSSSVDLG